MTSPIQTELAHLLRLLDPPWTNGWWAYVKDKADRLAASDPALAELPALVKAERDQIKAQAMHAKATDTSGTEAT